MNYLSDVSNEGKNYNFKFTPFNDKSPYNVYDIGQLFLPSTLIQLA